ncbi:hypothetical protein Dsin_018112 [Dipteronia sinensis]|uniref:RNase H type-1 domain-containing protein n=1 Tax=Dipteronia sinensis TaxID=43782 RepID=A0AAE0AGS7_9ROSI|nr:hypothetical protein Dsin_018112 [Dipteronia sinensis]
MGCWSPPPPMGSLKLNSDAAVKPKAAFIGVNAIIRDKLGGVVAALAKPLLGSFPGELGELLALREGLLLAKNLNVSVDWLDLRRVQSSPVPVPTRSSHRPLSSARSKLAVMAARLARIKGFPVQSHTEPGPISQSLAAVGDVVEVKIPDLSTSPPGPTEEAEVEIDPVKEVEVQTKLTEVVEAQADSVEVVEVQAEGAVPGVEILLLTQQLEPGGGSQCCRGSQPRRWAESRGEGHH